VGELLLYFFKILAAGEGMSFTYPREMVILYTISIALFQNSKWFNPFVVLTKIGNVVSYIRKF